MTAGKSAGETAAANFRMELFPKFSWGYSWRAAQWYFKKPHAFSYLLGWGVFVGMVYSIPITEEMRKNSKYANYDYFMKKEQEKH